MFYGWQWYSVSFDTQKTRDPNFGGGGSVIWNFSVRSILMKWQPFLNFFIMADSDIPFLSTLGKPETQTLGGVSNLKFFCMININEMAAIFQFFHNGQQWYSISVNTRKTRHPNFGGVSNLNFFCMININEMVAIFKFFHNGWQWYSISVDTFLHGDLSALGNLETQILCRFSFPNFSVGSVPPSPIQHLCMVHKTFMHGHLCVVTFLHFIQESAKKNPPK